MNDEDFQGRVLRELGQINTTLAVISERQDVHRRRLDAVEKWQDQADDKADATGRHELSELKAKVAGRRKEWLGWLGKAALLVVGSVLAILAGACRTMLGL